MIRWIDIERKGRTDSGSSSFAIYDEDPDYLEVVGGLPHTFKIRPKTIKDRDAMIEWLRGLEF